MAKMELDYLLLLWSRQGVTAELPKFDILKLPLEIHHGTFICTQVGSGEVGGLLMCTNEFRMLLPL